MNEDAPYIWARGYNVYRGIDGPVSNPEALEITRTLFKYLMKRHKEEFGKDVAQISISEVMDSSVTDASDTKTVDGVTYDRRFRYLHAEIVVDNELLDLPVAEMKSAYATRFAQMFEKLFARTDSLGLDWDEKETKAEVQEAIEIFLSTQGAIPRAVLAPNSFDARKPFWAERIYQTGTPVSIFEMHEKPIDQIKDTFFFVWIDKGPGNPTRIDLLHKEGFHEYAKSQLPEDFLQDPQDVVLYTDNKNAKKLVIRGLYDSYPGVAATPDPKSYVGWTGTGHSGIERFARWDMLLDHVGITVSMADAGVLAFCMGSLFDSLKLANVKEYNICINILDGKYPTDEAPH